MLRLLSAVRAGWPGKVRARETTASPAARDPPPPVAMLRLLSSVRAGWPLPAAAAYLHRHLALPLSTATASPALFVAEDYLVTTCGLTPAQALKSSRYIPGLKSPSNADAVVTFLADTGLAKAEVAAAIARDPRLLCSNVDKTLLPRIGKLVDIGLTPPQICCLINTNPSILRSHLWVSRFEFYLTFLGSFEKVCATLKISPYLLSQDVERVVKPNIAFLRQCGQTDCDVVKIFSLAPRMVLLEPERVKEIVACVDRLGVPRDSGMFKHALKAVYSIRPERISARSKLLKKGLGCSKDELSIAVRKFPNVLNYTAAKVIPAIEFLKMEVGLKAHYIVRRPALLGYSLERRLMPRHYVLKVLQSKGLVERDMTFFNVACLSDERFSRKFIDPYKERVPGLADAAALCRPIFS